MFRSPAILFLTVAASMSSLAAPATVDIRPSADTSLFEPNPTHNLGASVHLASGTVSGGKKSRMLLKFDLESVIPRGATIRSATLELEVVRIPLSGGAASVFELRRVQRDWREGAKTGNTGQTASEGEATWERRTGSAELWAVPGASAPTDFSETVSAEVSLHEPKRYVVASTPQLVADVQVWTDNSATNFGWIVLSQSESKSETARRIAAREDATRGPLLRVGFDPPPAQNDSFRFTSAGLVNRKVVLQWEGGIPPYQLQTRSGLDADWKNSGPAVSESSVSVEPSGAQGYFRMISEAVARYEVVFNSTWSASTHPDRFPPGPHWSGLVGGTHNNQMAFWAEGNPASVGIKNMAELGSKIALLQEVRTAISNGTAWSELSGGGINPSPGTVSLSFDVHREYPLVTLTSMIAPSPDWFVGVAGLNLIENNRWVPEKTVTLFLYDAGTDSGATYTAPDLVTAPAEPIRRIEGFPASLNGQLTTFGTFRFRKL